MIPGVNTLSQGHPSDNGSVIRTWSYAQSWLKCINEGIDTHFEATVSICSLGIFCGLYILYDYYRPTAPFRLASKLRIKRLVNWFILILCQMAEIASNSSLYILAAAPLSALDECGLKSVDLKALIIITLFVKAIGLLIFGPLIDRFKALKAGKNLLIASTTIQGVSNFILASTLVLAAESQHSDSSPIVFKFINSLTRFKRVLLYILYISGAFLSSISHISLVKLCAIWYRGTEERATISGLLNVEYALELVVAFCFDTYIFKSYKSLDSLLLISSLLFLVSIVCCLFISYHLSPSIDLHFYMYLFNKQQSMLEMRERESNKALSDDSFIDDDEQSIAPTDHELSEALQIFVQEENEQQANLEQKDIEETIALNKFPFQDPLSVDMNVSIKSIFKHYELWVYVFCMMLVSIVDYDFFPWLLSYCLSTFKGVSESALIILIVLICLSPAFSVWPSIVLNNLFARHKHLNMSLLFGLSMMLFGAFSAAVVFCNDFVIYATFAFISMLAKYMSFSVSLFWSINLGGAAHSGAIGAIMGSAVCVGRGIGAIVFQDISKSVFTYKLLLVIIPIATSIVLLFVGIKNVIKKTCRHKMRGTQQK
jgi:hypothetical protein